VGVFFVPLYAWIAIGSAVGGVIRFVLGTFIQQRTGSLFPVGTLAINVSGSLVLGFLVRYTLATPAIGPEVRALLTAGLCGGYTTFSTFSYETVALIEEGDYHRAAWYVALSLLLSLAATILGMGLAREVLNLRRRL
jgi:CrcB protein